MASQGFSAQCTLFARFKTRSGGLAGCSVVAVMYGGSQCVKALCYAVRIAWCALRTVRIVALYPTLVVTGNSQWSRGSTPTPVFEI